MQQQYVFGSLFLGTLVLSGAAVVFLTQPSSHPVTGPARTVDFTHLDSLPPEGARVQINGMAHYGAQVVQTYEATLFDEARTVYLFGLFDKHDTDSRGIRVLVQSERRPEDLVSFEYMEVVGWMTPGTLQNISLEIDDLIGRRTDYYLAEGVVLLDASQIATLE